jgi:hypothetical protein
MTRPSHDLACGGSGCDDLTARAAAVFEQARPSGLLRRELAHDGCEHRDNDTLPRCRCPNYAFDARDVLPHTRADATRDRLMETAGSCDTLSVRSMGAWLTYSSSQRALLHGRSQLELGVLGRADHDRRESQRATRAPARPAQAAWLIGKVAWVIAWSLQRSPRKVG